MSNVESNNKVILNMQKYGFHAYFSPKIVQNRTGYHHKINDQILHWVALGEIHMKQFSTQKHALRVFGSILQFMFEYFRIYDVWDIIWLSPFRERERERVNFPSSIAWNVPQKISMDD